MFQLKQLLFHQTHWTTESWIYVHWTFFLFDNSLLYQFTGCFSFTSKIFHLSHFPAHKQLHSDIVFKRHSKYISPVVCLTCSKLVNDPGSFASQLLWTSSALHHKNHSLPVLIFPASTALISLAYYISSAIHLGHFKFTQGDSLPVFLL